MAPSRVRIFSVVLFGVLAASTASILIRLTPAPSATIAAGRMAFSSILLTPFFIINLRRHPGELQKRRLLLGLGAGILLAGHFALWIESLRHTTVVSSVILVALNPIFVALAAPFLLKERLSLRGGLAVIIGFAGAVLIAAPALRKTAPAFGNLLALGGAVCAAGYVLLGRKLRPGLSLLNYVYPVYTFAALILIIYALFTRAPLFGHPPKTYLYILLLALGPQILGHTSFNWALAFLPAPVVALTILGEPVGTTILSTLILSQPPTLPELAGGVLICIGIYLVAARP